jgi:hypothetical protein
MIWITQWLCPERHCCIALAWDDALTNEQEAAKKGEELFQSGVLISWCGICNGKLHIEHERTDFKTMEEAMPSLVLTEIANAFARKILQRRN